MKKFKIFEGVGTALVTPFRDNAIDYGALSQLIDMQVEAGVEALIVGGTTGEAATLTPLERETLFHRARELTAGRVKLVLGTGTNDTAEALLRTRMAERIGCDGVLVVTPYYNKGTEEGIFRHYLTIAEGSTLPVMLYNVPSRTGVNLGLNLLSRLSEHPNIVGLKEAGDSTDRLVALSAFGEALPLYAGNDSQIFPTLALGGAGVISVVSNLLPERVKAITDGYASGDRQRSLREQHRLLPLIRALFSETNPAPVKLAMQELGLCSGEVRLPLYEPRSSTADAVRKALSELE